MEFFKKNKVVQFLVTSLLEVMLFTFLSTPRMSYADTFSARWVNLAISNSASVKAPVSNWTAMVRVKKNQAKDPSSYQYRSGEKWMTLQREEVALIPGFTSKNLTDLIESPLKGVALIYGRFVPRTSKLVVNVMKVEDGSDGYVTIYQTYFTPFHGAHWAAAQHFLTADEIASDRNQAGRNPFASFMSVSGDQTDPTFYNVNFDAAFVVLGQAAAYYHSVFAVLNVENLDMKSWTTTSGGWFHKTTTIHVQGNADPQWYIGRPSFATPTGVMASICVVPTPYIGDPSAGQRQPCPDANLVASSGLSFDEWKGNTFSMTPEQIYYWETSHSGFTVLFFMIVVFVLAVVTAGAALMAMAAEGALAEGVAATAVEIGAATSLTYGAVSLVTTNQGASLTSQKSGIFGAIGDGTNKPGSFGSDQERDAAAILDQRHIAEPITGNLLNAPKAGVASVTPDANNVNLKGDQKAMRDRYTYCKYQLNLSSDALRNCYLSPNAPTPAGS